MWEMVKVTKPRAKAKPKVKAVMGRPTDYTPELGDRILKLMSEGLSLAAAAAECDVHRQRVYDWADRHAEFADTVNLAKSKRQNFLERRLLSAREGPMVTSTIFALKNAGQGDWRDRVETELTGAGGGPVQTQELPVGDLSEATLRELAAKAKMR